MENKLPELKGCSEQTSDLTLLPQFTSVRNRHGMRKSVSEGAIRPILKDGQDLSSPSGAQISKKLTINNLSKPRCYTHHLIKATEGNRNESQRIRCEGSFAVASPGY